MQFVWQRVEKKKLVKCTCFFFAAQRSRIKIVHHTTIRGKSRGAPEKEPYCESQFLPSIIICQCLLNLNNDSWNFHVIYKTYYYILQNVWKFCKITIDFKRNTVWAINDRLSGNPREPLGTPRESPGNPREPSGSHRGGFPEFSSVHFFFQILSEEKFPVGFQIIRHWQTTEYLNILDIFKRCWFLIILNQQKT